MKNIKKYTEIESKLISFLLVAIILLSNISIFASENNNPGTNTKIEVEESNINNQKEEKEVRNGTLDSDTPYLFYDETGYMKDYTKNSIIKINKTFEEEGTEVGVIVLKSLNGKDIEEEISSLFDVWKVGNQDRNNGVLMLISVEDNSFRIIVGSGLRNSVLDAYEVEDIVNKVVPYFRADSYNLGINVFLFDIAQKFSEYRNQLIETKVQEPNKVEENQYKEEGAVYSFDKFMGSILKIAMKAIIASAIIYTFKTIIDIMKKEHQANRREENDRKLYEKNNDSWKEIKTVNYKNPEKQTETTQSEKNFNDNKKLITDTKKKYYKSNQEEKLNLKNKAVKDMSDNSSDNYWYYVYKNLKDSGNKSENESENQELQITNNFDINNSDSIIDINNSYNDFFKDALNKEYEEFFGTNMSANSGKDNKGENSSDEKGE